VAAAVVGGHDGSHTDDDHLRGDTAAVKSKEGLQSDQEEAETGVSLWFVISWRKKVVKLGGFLLVGV
jgi:hypothetical protein